MSAKILKSRAKRLRHAIEKMLGIPVSHSQALELVAKEENYPHWDAACAAHPKALPKERYTPLVRELRTQIRPDWVGQYDEVFANNPQLGKEIQDFLRTPKGGLVILAGSTGCGMTTTLSQMADEALIQGHDSVDFYQFGKQEREYPAAIKWVNASGGQSIMDSARSRSDIVFVDDLRCGRVAYEALQLAQIGFKVVVGLHATDPIVRIKTLMGQAGLGEFSGQIDQLTFLLMFEQQPVWPAAGMQEIWRSRLRKLEGIGLADDLRNLGGQSPLEAWL
ncbi:ATPase, T2SS/T4P/T4SS family [Pseudomonas sp. S1(2024)]|uniref:glyoxalase superfamily protein n=1 Tax=Pseudomonas sp. S1(2024) TaxID=3390191 RepID=UPI00397A5B9C